MVRHLITETLSEAAHHFTDEQIDAIDMHLSSNAAARQNAELKNTLPPTIGDTLPALVDEDTRRKLLQHQLSTRAAISLVSGSYVSSATLLRHDHTASDIPTYLNERSSLQELLDEVTDGREFLTSSSLHTDAYKSGAKILVARRALGLSGHGLPFRVIERHSFASTDKVRSKDAERLAFGQQRDERDSRGNLTLVPLSSTVYVTGKPLVGAK